MARTHDTSDDDDLEYHPPTREEVFAQLEDWRRRLHKLYADIISWLPEGEGYETEIRDYMTDEGPMRVASVPPQPVPELRVYRHGDTGLIFTPDACWIIGVAGRIHIHEMNRHTQPHELVDSSSPFVDPGWRLFHNNWRDRYKSSIASPSSLSRGISPSNRNETLPLYFMGDRSLLRGIPFNREELLALLERRDG